MSVDGDDGGGGDAGEVEEGDDGATATAAIEVDALELEAWRRGVMVMVTMSIRCPFRTGLN